MNSFHPNDPPLRDHQQVRDAIDRKLGQARGMTPQEAWDLLSHPERAGWVLGELVICLLDFRFHIWLQRYADPERPFDGTDWVARVAEHGRELDSEVVDLFRWTAARAAGVRAGTRGEGLMSVVPSVWSAVWTGRVPPFLYGVIERWPEDLDLASLPLPAWERTVVQPAEGSPRYPTCAVGYTEAGSVCLHVAPPTREGILETTSYALWKAGASDDELDAFYFEDEGDALPEKLARWVSFDGDGGDPDRFAALRRALDPLPQLLGIPDTNGCLVVRVEADRLDDLAATLTERCSAIYLEPDETRDLLSLVRSALRTDVDLLVLDAADLQPDHAQVFFQAVLTGHMLVLGGSSAPAEALLTQLAAAGTRVLHSER